MKIYTFYENEIHSLEVKETKSRFTAKERHPAFGWSLYFDKDRFARSEREAIDLAINQRMKKRTLLRKEMDKIDHDLNVLYYLFEESPQKKAE